MNELDSWIEDAIRRSQFVERIYDEVLMMITPFLAANDNAMEFVSLLQPMDIALSINGYPRFCEQLQQRTEIARELAALIVHVDTELRFRYGTQVLTTIANGVIVVENGLSERPSEMYKIAQNEMVSDYRTSTELLVIWIIIRTAKLSLMRAMEMVNKK